MGSESIDTLFCILLVCGMWWGAVTRRSCGGPLNWSTWTSWVPTSAPLARTGRADRPKCGRWRRDAVPSGH